MTERPEHPEKLLDETVLPCGCTIAADQGTLTAFYKPCSTDCPNFVYFTQEARRLGKQVEAIDLREPTPMPTCPWCGQKIVAVEEVGGSGYTRPSLGDVTICFECIKPAVFESDLTLRRMRDDERESNIEAAMLLLQEFKDAKDAKDDRRSS